MWSCTDLLRKGIGSKGSNCFSRGPRTRITIDTCDIFSGGGGGGGGESNVPLLGPSIKKNAALEVTVHKIKLLDNIYSEKQLKDI